jgi:hypothetical protein
MEIESTLRVISESQVKKLPGVVQGQTVQPLVGVPEFPSERVRVAVATFQPGVHEELHWHAIEVFYYVMAGSDREGLPRQGARCQRRICHYAPPGTRLARVGRSVRTACSSFHARDARRPQAHAVHGGLRNAAPYIELTSWRRWMGEFSSYY